ncbi:MAG TPA: acyltransferase, partial [Magnetospirillaceae bacterium]|nr:acyltransferase [Magnetospirillaceae bacterium]
MLGLLRTTLSLFVFLSHMPKLGIGFSIGSFSVTLFYFISGFLISRSYENFRAKSSVPALGFYLDRLVRIYPGYAVAVLATIVLIKIGRSDFYSIGAIFPPPELTGHVLRWNAYLLRLNMDIPAIDGPTWSLAAEMQFYLVLPLLAVLPFPLFAAVVAASMGVQQYAYHALPPGDADWLAYRSLYGMMFVFCMGICLARRGDKRFAWLLAAAVVAQLVLLAIVYPMTKPFANSALMAIALAVLVAVPLVDFALRSGPPWLKPIDRFVGDLCYPIFLVHFPAMYCAD